VSGTDPAAGEPYTVLLSGQTRRNIRENLPLEIAFAAIETIDRSTAINPYRAGKPLDEPFDGYHSARRGTYRIIYRIDEAKHQVEIHSIRHRRDTYRTKLQERGIEDQVPVAAVPDDRGHAGRRHLVADNVSSGFSGPSKIS
jgi:mRNA interferase RelE/StbE